MFLASQGEYPPCGLYSAGHLLALLICLGAAVAVLALTARWGEKQIFRLLRILAPLLSLLELCKIAYQFSEGAVWPDAWLPLAYCSLFLYALWAAAYGKRGLRRVGVAFLSCGIVPGLGFLLMPSTSLVFYPLLHFLCQYSLLFHFLMVIVSMLLFRAKIGSTDRAGYRAYILFCCGFCTLAVLVNAWLGCNMMFLREPFNIPLAFLHRLQSYSQPLYTALIYVFYLTVPYWLSSGIYTVVSRLRSAQPERLHQLENKEKKAG